MLQLITVHVTSFLSLSSDNTYIDVSYSVFAVMLELT